MNCEPRRAAAMSAHGGGPDLWQRAFYRRFPSNAAVPAYVNDRLSTDSTTASVLSSLLAPLPKSGRHSDLESFIETVDQRVCLERLSEQTECAVGRRLS